MLVLGGCASAPELQGTQYAAPPANELSSLVFIRESSVPKKVYARIKVDDVMVAYLPDDRATWVQVSPGAHQIKMEFPALVGMSSPETSAVVQAGKTYYFRYQGGAPGSSTPIFSSGGTFSGTVSGGGKFWNRLDMIDEPNAKALLAHVLYVPAQTE